MEIQIECPICKNSHVSLLTEENNKEVYHGILKQIDSKTLSSNQWLPAKAFICRDCGYIMLFHVPTQENHQKQD